MTPSPTQFHAIKAIQDWLADPFAPQEFYLAGYAGTGKSTLISILLNDLDLEVCTAAYTGKAAHILREKGNPNTSTIHSLIYHVKPKSNPPIFYLKNKQELADLDLIVLDEVSMVSDDLARDLRSFGVRLLVLGDPGQLPPPKGLGAFTNKTPDVFLTEIHRQAAESPILCLATAARLGQPFPFTNSNARILPFSKPEILNRATQIICGTHKNRWALTSLIRTYNDFGTFPYPQESEPVICCRNEHSAGLFNGMLGTAANDSNVNPSKLISFDFYIEDQFREILSNPTLFDQHQTRKPTVPEYNKDEQLFDFGYVLTCHKAQGSEWDNVTIFDDSYAFRENRNKWLYTAITRASKTVTILSGKIQ